jgi:predicted PurR-regulated permease PerM
MNNNFKIFDLLIKIILLSLIGFWCFLLLRPFIVIFLWGIILAVGFYPIFKWLKNKFQGKEKLTATVIAIVSILIIIGPVGFLAKTLAANINQLVHSINDGTLVVPSPPDNLENLPVIGKQLDQIWASTSVNLAEAIKTFEPQLKKISTILLKIVTNLGLAIGQFIFAIIISTGLLLNAKFCNLYLIRFLTKLNPVKGKEFAELAFSTLRNVIRGVIGISVIQTLLVGIGMGLAGIPSAGLLTLICLILTIIQIGPALIVIGTIIYAWSKMNALIAVIYTIWMLPAMLIDNVLKPVLMARGLPVPMLVIFLGVFGGTITHGIIGLFVGPVILAFGYELLQLWINNDSTVVTEENKQ